MVVFGLGLALIGAELDQIPQSLTTQLLPALVILICPVVPQRSDPQVLPAELYVIIQLLCLWNTGIQPTASGWQLIELLLGKAQFFL